MLNTSAHTDSFARDNLPPQDQWPDFLLDKFDYPKTLNAGAELTDAMVEKGVIAGVPLSRLEPKADPNLLLVCATETSSDEDIIAYGTALKEVLS